SGARIAAPAARVLPAARTAGTGRRRDRAGDGLLARIGENAFVAGAAGAARATGGLAMKDLDEIEKGNASASRQLFERAVQGLDPGAANRLRLARRAAQAESASGSRLGWAPAL